MEERQREIGADAIRGWRKFVLDRVLLFALALLVLGFALTFRGDAFQKQIALYAIAPGLLLVAFALLWPRAPWQFRQWALVLGVCAAVSGSTLRAGFLVPNAFAAHLMLCVLVSLFMDRRAAWMVWAGGSLYLAVVAYQFISGASPRPDDLTFDVALPDNWFRVLGIYAAISAVTVASVSYLTDHTVEAVRRGEALYNALTQESSQRIAALEEQRELEEKLRQAQKLEALGTLAGGVAHDFNNLLVIIISNAELAAMEDIPEHIKRQLQDIREAGSRAAELTTQLLAFGRRQVVERAPLDLGARMAETVRMLRRLLPTSISIKLEAPRDHLVVWGAAVELDQVIMNLCVNARDAMPEGGDLTLEVNRVNRAGGDGRLQAYAKITIRDTGSGMDEATQTRLFEPFFTTKSSGEGTGLGMSLVHGIISEVQGSIEIDSKPGRGTSIDVYWPLGAPKSDATEQESAWPQPRGTETVMVVDDDPAVRKVVARQLTRAGYHLLACGNGEEALELFAQHGGNVDLVLTDAVMPKMGGRQLHRELTARYGEIPFVICSGYAAQTLEASFFDHPNRAFLAKPFTAQSLQEAVRKMLDATKRASIRPAAELNPQQA